MAKKKERPMFITVRRDDGSPHGSVPVTRTKIRAQEEVDKFLTDAEKKQFKTIQVKLIKGKIPVRLQRMKRQSWWWITLYERGNTTNKPVTSSKADADNAIEGIEFLYQVCKVQKA